MNFLWPVTFSVLAAGAAPQDFLPPASSWHGASEALIAKPDNPWITPAERAQLLDSPDYEETMAYLKKLCAASPRLEGLCRHLTSQQHQGENGNQHRQKELSSIAG
jgi:hypothetical protein